MLPTMPSPNPKMKMGIHSIDHVVLTVKDLEKTSLFYQNVVGMVPERFGPNKERIALTFGEQKINLHQSGAEFKPHAAIPTSGSMDICFISQQPLHAAMKHVRSQGITIEEGPVQRTGACGPIQSFYFRDPDRNLIEIANYSAQKTSLFKSQFMKGTIKPNFCFTKGTCVGFLGAAVLSYIWNQQK